MISAVAVFAVNENNDTDKDKDPNLKGVKWINDMGVFTVTTVFSIFSYIWLWIVLKDQRVEIWEAVLTLVFFFVLIIFSYGADRYNSYKENKQRQLLGKKDEDEMPFIEYDALEIQRELTAEAEGHPPSDPEKRQKMKQFLKIHLGTEVIQSIDFNELKKKVDGESMLARIKYRKQVQAQMTCKKPAVAKGEIVKLEHAHAANLDKRDRNPEFGFKCLHYSVSEGSGSIRIYIENKKGLNKTIVVKTIDDQATGGEDYESIHQNLEFKAKEKEKYIEIKIFDDDHWEPDEDFYVQLYDIDGNELEGKDTKTKVTIIDDDKPGQICFEQDGTIDVDAMKPTAEITVIRKNGSDGKVSVHFETVMIDNSTHTATEGVDYQPVSGRLIFDNRETIKTISIPIIQKEGEENEHRNETFGLKLSNIHPEGAKLSKKNFLLVRIVTDIDSKKKQEALKQLLTQIEEEEEITWTQ